MEGSPRGRRTVQVARGGKLNKPNELCGAVIRLQRVCGQPCLCCGRGRSNHGVCTGVLRGWSWPKRPESSIAFGATSALPTVFPSLRTHEPLSCRGRDPIRTWPANYLKLNLLRAGLLAAKARGQTCETRPGPKSDQRPSVYEPAHADIHRHAQRKESKQHRRPAVTH